MTHIIRPSYPIVDPRGNYIATTTQELADYVATAVAGEVVWIEPGTYTLTSTTGPITCVSGVTIKGAGSDLVNITEDGTLFADSKSIVQIHPSSSNTYYGNLGVAQGASTVRLATAAEAGNFSEGDVIVIGDVGASQRTWTFVARADGNSGTGDIDFYPPMPQAITAGASNTKVVITNEYFTDITLEGFTITGASGMTDLAMEISWHRNFRLKDVVFDQCAENSGSWAISIANCYNADIDVEMYESSAAYFNANTASRIKCSAFELATSTEDGLRMSRSYVNEAYLGVYGGSNPSNYGIYLGLGTSLSFINIHIFGITPGSNAWYMDATTAYNTVFYMERTAKAKSVAGTSNYYSGTDA